MARSPFEQSSAVGSPIWITSSLVAETFIVDNHEEEEKEEQVEHIEPPTTLSLSNDKEMSNEAHSIVTIPLRHSMNPKLHLFNVSKSHFMPRLSKIYANKRAKLGTIILRRSF
jgi:hypothetical protein